MQKLSTLIVPNARAGTGPRNSKMYTGRDTTRFLGMWLVDFSHGSTVACMKWERWNVQQANLMVQIGNLIPAVEK